jgi:hypothetical protein
MAILKEVSWVDLVVNIQDTLLSSQPSRTEAEGLRVGRKEADLNPPPADQGRAGASQPTFLLISLPAPLSTSRRDHLLDISHCHHHQYPMIINNSSRLQLFLVDINSSWQLLLINSKKAAMVWPLSFTLMPFLPSLRRRLRMTWPH